jgi:hypothetical protein
VWVSGVAVVDFMRRTRPPFWGAGGVEEGEFEAFAVGGELALEADAVANVAVGGRD